jgi:hypothetical protein
MTSEEQERKIVQDLAATRSIIQQSNQLLRRIERASGKLLENEGTKDVHRRKPA